MPTISFFYGIYIMMNLRNKEHNPPHIHAFYGENASTFYISNGEIYEATSLARQRKWLKNSFLVIKKNY